MVRREFCGLNFRKGLALKTLRGDFRFVFIFIGNIMMKRQLMGAGILGLGLLL